jgi:ATP-dependent DNA helicase DinG
LEGAAADLVEQLENIFQLFNPLRDEAEGLDDDLRYRFPGGRVDAAHREMSELLYRGSLRLQGHVDALHRAIEGQLSAVESGSKEGLEYWLPLIAAMSARIESTANLWQQYMLPDPVADPPKARWINFRESDELMVQSSPIAVHESLQELLWDRCFGAVITSATLAVGGDFRRFRERAGLSDENRFNTLRSPFRFNEQAILRIPKMDVDPREANDHSDAVAALLPGLLTGVTGMLVLFASWRQMYRVSDTLPDEFMDMVMSQGTFSKAEIISRHKALVDSGSTSVIFGLASFAEGIDLPGDYCNHVVIVKIPFSVPNDPVGATLSEWIEEKGGNSFQEIMIPDAVLRMVQACGRLLRTETDTGVVTILDRRLVTKRYGGMLLDALPPFKREIG